MIRVSRTDVRRGTSRELNVTEKCWKRITQAPSVFGANLKWERIKASPEGKFDPGAKHAHDDLAEQAKPVYTDEAYKYDCEQGKKFFDSGEYSKAIEFLKRAISHQPRNQYVRKLIKQIEDGKGAAN